MRIVRPKEALPCHTDDRKLQIPHPSIKTCLIYDLYLKQQNIQVDKYWIYIVNRKALNDRSNIIKIRRIEFIDRITQGNGNDIKRLSLSITPVT